MQRVELLSPAGDFEKLKMAVLYGADAVYLSGKQFGLRAFAGNFDLVEMQDAVIFAHENQVRVYVTLNIFAHQDDFDELEDYIKQLEIIGVDAVILSDPGIFSLVRNTCPGMEIHISTQANVTNAKSCIFWHKLGAKRIVLARELTLEEIISIRKEIPDGPELEVFVHGAMCMTYSGRCILSNYFAGRDANKGECVQPCRWKYQLVEESRQDKPLFIEEDSRGSYILNSRDMCMIEHIPELVRTGINSFKIEGRMKGLFYVATVTKAYREAMDHYFNNPDTYSFDPVLLEDLKKTVHREFDTGFFFDKPTNNAKIFMNDSYIKEAKVAGIILAYDELSKRALIQQRNKIFEGDKLEIVSPRGRHVIITAKDLLDEEGNEIESTPHAKMIYSMKVRVPVNENSFIRIVEN